MADRDRRALIAAGLLCAASMLFLAIRLVDGLSSLSFFDEATHVLGGQVLDHGGLLYRDFVDTHGPLIFFIAQAWGALFGWSDPNHARLVIALLAVLCGVSVAASPVLDTPKARLCGVALFCGLLGVAWLRQGLNLFSFYPLGGALASIGLAGFVIPACLGFRPRSVHAVLAGMSLSLLAGVAYSFLPSIALFALAGCVSASLHGHRNAAIGFLCGGLGGLAFWLVGLARFADLHGYLAFHFAENQFVYSRYVYFTGWTFLRSLLPSPAPAWRTQGFAVLCVAVSLLSAAWQRRHLPAMLPVLIGVLALNARGANSFQDGTFVWAAIATVALMVGNKLVRLSGTRGVALCAGMVLGTAAFLQGALFMPFEMDNRTMAATPAWPIGNRSDGAFFSAIRRYAHPDERILALTYEPQLYLLAGRLPMRGFYAYFAWDADYARDPWFGRPRDLCEALASRPPPVIVFDDYAIWGYRPEAYMPCLFQELREHYVADSRFHDVHGTLYVRKDRALPIDPLRGPIAGGQSPPGHPMVRPGFRAPSP